MTTTPAAPPPPPLRHVNESPCIETGCDWIAELGEAFCVQHGGGEMVEHLREPAQ